MNINQAFSVCMVLVDEQGNEMVVAPNLCKAIQSWEIEVNEPEDDPDDDGFLVAEDQDADDSDDSTDDAEPDDEDEPEVADRTLVLTSVLNKLALSEFKSLVNGEVQDLKVQFIYGNDEVGKITREFLCDTDGLLSVGTSGSCGEGADTTDLQVELVFDVYDSDTLY